MTVQTSSCLTLSEETLAYEQDTYVQGAFGSVADPDTKDTIALMLHF